MWAHIGIVQAVLTRSLNAGVEMYEIITEEAERAAEGKGSPGLVRRLVGATAEQKMERALARYPGLIEFMAEQTQDDWEEGAEALGVGELDLGLFSEAEISAAFAHAESLGFHLQKGDLISEEEPAAAAAQALGQWMLSYVRDLATPERLAEMQAQIDEFAAQEEEPAWLTFLSLMRSELEEPDGSEHLYSLLVHALAGEMQNSVRKKVEEG
jgi:hypothetical protein